MPFAVSWPGISNKFNQVVLGFLRRHEHVPFEAHDGQTIANRLALPFQPDAERIRQRLRPYKPSQPQQMQSAASMRRGASTSLVRSQATKGSPEFVYSVLGRSIYAHCSLSRPGRSY